MINKQILEELSAQIASLLPRAEAAKEDTKQFLHASLHSAFERLDLVTREDFEAQRQLLDRSQQRITQLEEALAELEQQLLERNSAD